MKRLIPAVILSFSARAWASWPDVSKPATEVGGGSGDAAVIVGIEKYAFVSPVEGAKDNALAWYDYLNASRTCAIWMFGTCPSCQLEAELLLFRNAFLTTTLPGQGKTKKAL